jgi:hypothetical protein
MGRFSGALMSPFLTSNAPGLCRQFVSSHQSRDWPTVEAKPKTCHRKKQYSFKINSLAIAVKNNLAEIKVLERDFGQIREALDKNVFTGVGTP